MKLLPLIVCLLAISACSKKSKGKSDSSPAAAEPEVVTETPVEEEKKDTAIYLKFLTPSDTSQRIVKGASYDIAIEFKNAAATASWSLFYSATKDSVVGGLPILEDLPIATTKVSWDTSFVDPGVYYVYVVFVNDNITNIYFAPGSFKFEGNLDLNKPPVTTMASPDGNMAYAPGDSIPITFTAVDPDDDDLDIKIEYTADGTTWDVIADNLTKDVNQYQWNVPTDAPQSARYRIRVSATDGKLSSNVLNNKVFGVTTTPVIYTGQVETLINASCAISGCHQGAIPAGELNLTTYGPANTAKLSILNRTRVGAASPMPQPGPGNPTLTPEDRDLIQLWIWNGGAQN